MDMMSKYADQGWEFIQPQVNAQAEFFEILNDFGNPLELLREAISNAIDAYATFMQIEFSVQEIDGISRSVIRIFDNGTGITKERLQQDFWGLGYSPSRDRKDAIGEKGHGTKIYLRSAHVIVKTQTNEGAYESVCDLPLAALARRILHEPRLRAIDKFLEHTGTEITIIGYNGDERSKFVQDVVRDYILWYTKVGSIEEVFGIKQYSDFKLYLKCIGELDYEEIQFGHIFPSENENIVRLFDELGTEAADLYVKHYKYEHLRLKNHPEVAFQVFISIEGDAIKRKYNPMIRERIRGDTGKYRVGDRYGLWLCKDYIPITRTNEWIVNFGSGSNAYVLLHAFVNCQSLKLTANRGTFSNTDPRILDELREAVQEIVSQIDSDLKDNGLYALREMQQEQVTLGQEAEDFKRRIKNLKSRRVAKLDEKLIYEPSNEAELFGLFMMVYALHPDLFPFEPIDYNTNRGIDIIAQNRGGGSITEGEHAYVELKYRLRTQFNHTYKHLRWILCWDFDKNVGTGSEFRGIEEADVRYLASDVDDDGYSIYYLDNKRRPTKIAVIRLAELLKERFSVVFEPQKRFLF